MNTRKVIILFTLCVFAIPAMAENALGSHSFIIWANGGISRYIGSTPGAAPTLGGGGAIGLGYEWRDQVLLFQTGLGGQYTQTGLKCDQLTYTIPKVYDSEGDLLDYQYIERGRKDQYTQLALQIPLLVGAHFNYFYFLAGAKVNVNINQTAKVKATYDTQGDYDLLIDPLAQMPNHQFYTDRDIETTKKYGLKVNIAASAEVGGEFHLREGRNADTFLRVAAFADFSLLDERTKSSSPMFQTSDIHNNVDKLDMMAGVAQVDYLHSGTAESAIRHLLAGVKLTLIFSNDRKYGCVMCEGGYPSRRDLRRGSRLQR